MKRLGSRPAPAREALPGDEAQKPGPAHSCAVSDPGPHKFTRLHSVPRPPRSWVTPLMTFQGGPGGKHLLGVGGHVSDPCQLHPGRREASSTCDPPGAFLVQCGLVHTGFHLHVCDFTLETSRLLRSPRW